MNTLPLLFLLVTVFPIIVKPISKAADDHNCPVQRCRHDGPVIQFPFRLQHYPLHCGNPQFEVSCSSFSNLTMMKLSSSSGFFLIQTIDYERQQFRVYDEDDCLPGRLLNFTLFFSLFQPADQIHREYCFPYFNYESNNYESNMLNVTLLNCTTAENMSETITRSDRFWKYTVINCLSVPGHYQVLAPTPYISPTDLPVDGPCSNLPALLLPVRTQVDNMYRCELDTGLLLEWSERRFPECQNCTGPCYFNYSRNEVLKCYPPIPRQKHKGTCLVSSPQNKYLLLKMALENMNAKTKGFHLCALRYGYLTSFDLL